MHAATIGKQGVWLMFCFRCLMLIMQIMLTVVTYAEESLLGAQDYQPSRERPIGMRGDGQGGFFGATPPLTWSDGTSVRVVTTKGKRSSQAVFTFDDRAVSKNLLWRQALPNWSNSSPIVVGNRVLVMCEPLEAFPLLLCFDAESGREQWRREISPLAEEDDQTRVRIRKQWTHLIGLSRELSILIYQRKKIRVALTNDPTDADALTRLARWEERAVPFAFEGLEYKKPGLAGDGFTWTSSSVEKYWNGRIKHDLAAYGCAFVPWDTQLNGNGGQAWMGYSHASPVSDGQSVWVYTGNNTAACIALDGNIRWQKRLGPAVYVNWYNYLHAPVLAGDHLLCSSNEELVCLQADSGAVLWRQRSKATNKRADPERGKARSGTLYPGAKVCIDGLWYFFWDDGRLYRVADGKGYDRILNTGEVLFSAFSPLVQNSRMVFAVSGKHTSLRCVEWFLKDGHMSCKDIWRSTHSGAKAWGGRIGTGGPMDGIWHQGRLYVGTAAESHGRSMVILDARDGSIIGKSFAMPQSRLGGPVAFRNGILSIHCQRNDYATFTIIDFDGNRLGSNYLACAPYPVAQRELMLGCNGRLQWAVRNIGAWHSSPYLVGDRMYLRSRQHLYCIAPTE